MPPKKQKWQNLNKPAWKKQVNVNTRRMKQLMRDIRRDVMRRTRNSADIDAWMENLSEYIAKNPFITGLYAEDAHEIVNMIADTITRTSLPPGSNQELMKGTIAEACMTMVTNVGEDMRTELQRIAVESYNQKNTPQQLAKLLGQRIDSFSKTRCQAIARTETMRAGNLANLLAAREDEMQSYSIDCDPDACPYCIEMYREGDTTRSDMTFFDINDTDHMPPFHPNCRCVPLFWPFKADNQTEIEEIEDVRTY